MLPTRISFVNKLSSIKFGSSVTFTWIFCYIQLVLHLHQLLVTPTPLDSLLSLSFNYSCSNTGFILQPHIPLIHQNMCYGGENDTNPDLTEFGILEEARYIDIVKDNINGTTSKWSRSCHPRGNALQVLLKHLEG